MAPTEVLAEQHAAGVRALLDGVDGRRRRQPVRRPAAARRAAHQPRHRRRPARRRSPGWPTARSTSSSAPTPSSRRASRSDSLGVVVIDEQHRFGVEQRAALRAKGDGDVVPDVLVMTATPIPRTAAMTVYGDLDVSVLDELPPGRTPITTHWADGPLQEEAAWADVRERGRRRAAGVRRAAR